jgi:hypothetical protein
LRFERTPAFEADWGRLTEDERQRFRRVVREQFNPACDRRASDPSRPWPRSLRVKSVAGAPGILEMTWSFAGPDGRATFQWVTVEGEPRIRWRRVGGHEVFGRP